MRCTHVANDSQNRRRQLQSFWRSEKNLRLLSLKKNKQQLLQLGSVAAAHPSAAGWMAGLLADMPMEKQELEIKKAQFLKEPRLPVIMWEEHACAIVSSVLLPWCPIVH